MYDIKILKREINKLKVDLKELVTHNEKDKELNTKRIIDKSQELDELIVSFMKKE
ncbi:Spo0E family sporulation regulatory protein-aspartic acid phosphatase [Selenihalanaerobacter shriftii]|uniref:Spo0E like sporulation regulatory protein n=1 Tax=Selenihalanaerobacter shriftii TaxID=142842 RepID=A0A1T4M572_9FIRM|nr:Spo0E family sporulation regulatory protein-aspartic acid phosphatase [Selenihalanaerobacter shriftii]SJZ62061.1 Spo0E like sporulation regulatory protein [Selenihalanaerobacter shriftii]